MMVRLLKCLLVVGNDAHGLIEHQARAAMSDHIAWYKEAKILIRGMGFCNRAGLDAPGMLTFA
jgi:hypothetical protein